MKPPLLEVRDVRKRYGGFTALHGVSFTVAEGEMFGLLGPNGAGKTTLLSILAGLMDATSGQAFFRGEPVTPDNPELRRLVGIVPQDLAIYEELTARENLAFFGRLYGARGGELWSRVDEVLAAIGLGDRADHRAGTFSGGMKRRLNLGLTLMHRPPLLFLDEPTTGVDPQSRNHIFEHVRTLNAEGTTVIYTSHYMEEVQTLCRRIGILESGRLIACDTLPSLLQRLDGEIRLRVEPLPPGLVGRVAALPGVRVETVGDDALRLVARDVPKALFGLVSVLNEMKVEPTSLETAEPNLERVFLHLTGRGLRD